MEKFIVYDIIKASSVQGYWIDNQGKLYIDHIKEVKLKTIEQVNRLKKSLFERKEKAVFYIVNGQKAIIEAVDGQQVILKHRIEWIESEYPKEGYIETLCKLYGGLTVKALGFKGYSITIWKA